MYFLMDKGFGFKHGNKHSELDETDMDGDFFFPLFDKGMLILNLQMFGNEVSWHSCAFPTKGAN